jgi:hypothetical protein
MLSGCFWRVLKKKTDEGLAAVKTGAMMARLPKAMRILIQHCGNHRYLRDDFGWSKDPSEARGFETSARALDVCMGHRLENVRIVLKFERPELDVPLPLRSSGCLN